MIRAARILTVLTFVTLALACGGDGPDAPAGVPARVDLRALPDTAIVGDTLVPDVRVLDGRGNLVAGAGVEVTTSSTGILEVLPTGKLRAIHEGWTVVRASSGDLRDSVKVVVRQVARGLRIDMPGDSIEFNSTQELVPAIYVVDGVGAPMARTQNVTFASSDTSILRVDAATGAITAVNAGSAQLVATAGGLEARRTIRVTLYEPFATLGELAQVATGRRSTCVRTAAGPTYCRTASGRPLAGTSTGIQEDPPSPVAAPAPLAPIAIGHGSSCGLTAGGEAYCWGAGLRPITMLTSDTIRTPVAMPRPAGVTSWTGFAFNRYSATDHCLLDQDHKAWCWGGNSLGALGPTLGFHADLRPLEGAPAFVKAQTSYLHGCGMTAAAELWCWGEDDGYQRDENFTGYPQSPRRLALPRAIRDFATTFQGTCVAYVEGDAECWGYSQLGTLGRPDDSRYKLPARVAVPGRVMSLYSGGSAACALNDGGELWCWGALRGWDTTVGVAPFHFAPGYTFTEASLSTTGIAAFLCARTTTGRVLCTTREDAR